MSAQPQGIVINGSVAGYFKEQLDELCKSHRVTLSDGAGFYVVNLLSDFAQSDKLFLPTEDARSRELVPLAELLARASDSVGEERVKLLKHLADSSLYIGGFFQESLETRHVDVNYYASMGGNAYGELSNTARKEQGPIFRELSEKFAKLMDLLAEMATLNIGLAQSARDVLKLYERWMNTGSARVGAALKRHGVIFNGGGAQ